MIVCRQLNVPFCDWEETVSDMIVYPEQRLDVHLGEMHHIARVTIFPTNSKGYFHLLTEEEMKQELKKY